MNETALWLNTAIDIRDLSPVTSPVNPLCPSFSFRARPRFKTRFCSRRFVRTHSFLLFLPFVRSFVRSFDRQREGFSQVVYAYSKYEPAHSKRSSSVRERVRARARARETSYSSSRRIETRLLAGVVVLDESHTTDRFNYSDIKSSCPYHLTVEWKFLIYRPGMPPLDRLFTW